MKRAVDFLKPLSQASDTMPGTVEALCQWVGVSLNLLRLLNEAEIGCLWGPA